MQVSREKKENYVNQSGFVINFVFACDKITWT